MNLFSSVFFVFSIIYLGAVIFLANQEAASGVPSTTLRWMLIALCVLVAIFACTIIQFALFGGIPADSAEAPLIPIDSTQAVMIFIVVVILVMIAYQVAVGQREILAFVRRMVGQSGLYDPAAAVHNVALFLALIYLAWCAVNFDPTTTYDQVDPVSVLRDAALQIAIAFLGIGLAIRRDLSQSLSRLGLRLPTGRDVILGIGVGIGLLILWYGFNIIWTALTAPEVISEQTRTSQQLALQFDTLPFAFLASISVALSEEILMRGALQPIFGVLLTSIFFALLHTQYWINPGLLLVFVVALFLGWLRQRYSTTSAIIAHFIYNFIQLIVLLCIVEAGV